MQQEQSSFSPGNLQSFPQNARVDFLLSQRSDLRNWVCIPLYFGFMFAPLYDHRDTFEQIVIVGMVIVLSWLWSRLFQVWMDSRIGIWKVPFTRNREPFRNHWRVASIFAAILLFVAGVAFIRRDSPDFSPNGWIERGEGTWLVTTILICGKRVLEQANPRERRVWNAVAAATLLMGFGLLGISQQSYAAVLVLSGFVNLCLALLDVKLLVYYAATPTLEGSQEARV